MWIKSCILGQSPQRRGFGTMWKGEEGLVGRAKVLSMYNSTYYYTEIYGVQCIGFLACIFGPILYSYFKEFRTQYVCISYHL